MADWRCPCHGQSSGARSQIATSSDGVAAQRLAEAATESWQSGQVVRL
jgi:hypothetical protein